MGKFRVRAFTDVLLDLVPVTAIIAYALARSADGDEAFQGPDLGKTLLQVFYGLDMGGDIVNEPA